MYALMCALMYALMCVSHACVLVQTTTGFKYLPFGGGRRKCIGDQFALLESVVALAMLQRRYTFEMHSSAGPVTMVSGATIHTGGGLPVRLIPRDHTGAATDTDSEPESFSAAAPMPAAAPVPARV